MPPTRYCKAFFDLQLEFARVVASAAGLRPDRALLDYTNLYVRLGLGRSFDEADPVWRRYVDGLNTATDPGEWTYRFILASPDDVLPPSMEARSGCFSFARPDPECIRLHFHNAQTDSTSPLDAACLDARLAELRTLFMRVQIAGPAPKTVAGTSWLYNIDAYRRLFPPSYLASAQVAHPRYRNLSLWGQFLDRHGSLRQDRADVFLRRLARASDMAAIGRCFPFQALAVEAPPGDFYSFYGLAQRTV